jgi:transposase
MLLLCFLVVIFPFVPLARVSAHGEAGMTLTGTADGYTGDVDYDNTFVEVGTSGRFVFNLFKGDTIDVVGTGVEFDDLWVRVMKKDETKNGKMIFAGPLHKPLFGGTGISLLIPEAGDYTIIVRYNKDDDKIVEITYAFTAFSLAVEKKLYDEKNFRLGAVFGALTMVFVGIGVFALRSLKRKRKGIIE